MNLSNAKLNILIKTSKPIFLEFKYLNFKIFNHPTRSSKVDTK